LRPHLTVVIPAYNEENRLGGTLEKIDAYLSANEIHAEFVIVDDGSRDRTGEIATRFLQGREGRLLRNPENRGKGYSIRRGFKDARGRWVLMTDADLSAPIEEHAKLAAAVRDHDLDIAVGSRALRDSCVEVRQHPVRELLGKTFNRIIRLSTGLPFRDTQCGFKLIDHARLAPLFERMQVDRFAFDVEMLFLADRFSLRVKEVPVVWRNDPVSRVRLWKDPLNMLVDVVRIRWAFRRGVYNPSVPD